MNDSADIKMAADRLQGALKSLEGALAPLLLRIGDLETAAREAQAMDADRAELAKQLDLAKAREDAYIAREQEFNALADETTQELDRVIKQVQKVLVED